MTKTMPPPIPAPATRLPNLIAHAEYCLHQAEEGHLRRGYFELVYNTLLISLPPGSGPEPISIPAGCRACFERYIIALRDLIDRAKQTQADPQTAPQTAMQGSGN